MRGHGVVQMCQTEEYLAGGTWLQEEQTKGREISNPHSFAATEYLRFSFQLFLSFVMQEKLVEKGF